MLYALGDSTPEIATEGTWIADSATVLGKVRLRAFASVWFNAVIRGDNEWIEIGERSNIQDGSVLQKVASSRGLPIAYPVCLRP